jgi:hypothetical protein
MVRGHEDLLCFAKPKNGEAFRGGAVGRPAEESSIYAED